MGLHHQARRALRHREPEFWEQADGVDALVIGGGDLLHHGTTVVQHEGAMARIENWSFVEAGLLGEVRPVAWNAARRSLRHPPASWAPALRARRARRSAAPHRQGRRVAAAARSGGGGSGHRGRAGHGGPHRRRHHRSRTRRGPRLAAEGRARSPRPDRCWWRTRRFTSPVRARRAGAARCRASVERHPDLHVVLLPIGPAHDDVSTLRGVAEQLGHRSWLVSDPSVVEISAVLGAATTVVLDQLPRHAGRIGLRRAVACRSRTTGTDPPSSRTSLDQLDRSQWLLDRPVRHPRGPRRGPRGFGR